MRKATVAGSTLSVTHIYDGEEVVTGGEDGQVWIATFADPDEAAWFVQDLQGREAVCGEAK